LVVRLQELSAIVADSADAMKRGEKLLVDLFSTKKEEKEKTKNQQDRRRGRKEHNRGLAVHTRERRILAVTIEIAGEMKKRARGVRSPSL
jgi:hypothetical protein